MQTVAWYPSLLYQIQQHHFKDGLILWAIYNAFHWTNYMAFIILSCIPLQRPVFTCIRQNIKLSLSHALLYSFIVVKYLWNGESWLIILGIWGGGGAELFLGIWGAKTNTFTETRKVFAGIWGDQCIIFRDQGSTDPPGGLSYEIITLHDTCRSSINKSRAQWFSGRVLDSRPMCCGVEPHQRHCGVSLSKTHHVILA